MYIKKKKQGGMGRANQHWSATQSEAMLGVSKPSLPYLTLPDLRFSKAR